MEMETQVKSESRFSKIWNSDAVKTTALVLISVGLGVKLGKCLATTEETTTEVQ